MKSSTLKYKIKKKKKPTWKIKKDLKHAGFNDEARLVLGQQSPRAWAWDKPAHLS